MDNDTKVKLTIGKYQYVKKQDKPMEEEDLDVEVVSVTRRSRRDDVVKPK